MTILLHKQVITFVDYGKLNKKTKQLDGGTGEQVTVKPVTGPQVVPDWVRDTDTFKQAVKSGLITEINVLTQQAEMVAPVKAAPNVGFTGQGPRTRR